MVMIPFMSDKQAYTFSRNTKNGYWTVFKLWFTDDGCIWTSRLPSYHLGRSLLNRISDGFLPPKAPGSTPSKDAATLGYRPAHMTDYTTQMSCKHFSYNVLTSYLSTKWIISNVISIMIALHWQQVMVQDHSKHTFGTCPKVADSWKEFQAHSNQKQEQSHAVNLFLSNVSELSIYTVFISVCTLDLINFWTIYMKIHSHSINDTAISQPESIFSKLIMCHFSFWK